VWAGSLASQCYSGASEQLSMSSCMVASGHTSEGSILASCDMVSCPLGHWDQQQLVLSHLVTNDLEEDWGRVSPSTCPFGTSQGLCPQHSKFTTEL
jgi:hypothetical protein